MSNHIGFLEECELFQIWNAEGKRNTERGTNLPAFSQGIAGYRGNSVSSGAIQNIQRAYKNCVFTGGLEIFVPLGIELSRPNLHSNDDLLLDT